MEKANTKILYKRVIMYLCVIFTFLLITVSGCDAKKELEPIVVEEQSDSATTDLAESQIDETFIPEQENMEDGDEQEAEVVTAEVFSIIDGNGTTLETRIHTPQGYARTPSVSEELTGFLRSLPLKETGSELLLYDGRIKGNQDSHAAIFNLDLGDRDLQQCADSIIRIYAEYYWSLGTYDKIDFHLTNGFLMEYTKWREGYRIVVDGNEVRYNKTASYDDSYEEFRRYLTTVFAYAGTLSLSQECEEITLEEIRPGDMFLQGGSPGHCILVVDSAENADGNRCFLLAQGYMPAQDFHVIKNPLHPEDPWYYTSEINYPLNTPAWTFEEGSLVRWGDFPLNTANTPVVLSSLSNSVPVSNSDSEVVPAISDNLLTIPKEKNKVTLLAVGDNLIHLEVVQSGKQTNGTYNFDHLYSNLNEEISAADIAIVNQETILGGNEFAYSGYPNFNSPTEIGDALINVGFDVVLHATNHTLDKGLKGVENTIKYWKAHPDITVLGMNESIEASEKIPIIEKNGIKLAMLNYTYSLNGYTLPKDKPYLVNMLNKKKMSADIKKAEALADFTIVFPHWGTEYVYEATSAQEDLTAFYYEQGVDLVIGTHPHVLEPVEWIKTQKDHSMLVYYSLGNFMSYQKEAPRMLGGIANITITKDAGGTYISDSGITPIVTHYEHGPSDFNYAIYKLNDYTQAQAYVHGVSEIARNGKFTYQGTFDLAKEVLGSWFR